LLQIFRRGSPYEEQAMTLPAVTITDIDRERLISTAADAFSDERASPSASLLLSEISRATVVSSGCVSSDVVIMHREIEIRDNIHMIKRRLKLVYPDEDLVYRGEDGVAREAVSVLTPLGVALIGLSMSDTIEWCTRTGDRRSVTVLRTFPFVGQNAEEAHE
jgi:regulator of nucleoside diphosphate kinase